MNATNDKTEGKRLSWFKWALYGGIINLIFAVVITINNILTIESYMNELISFTGLMIIIGGVIILLNLAVSVLPSIVGSSRYKWSEDKQSYIFFRSFLLSTPVLVGGSCIILFFLYYMDFDLLAGGDIYYASWWFSSYTIVILALFILYVYKVFKELKLTNQ